MNMMVGGGCRSGSGGGGISSGCVNKSVVVTQVAFTTVSVYGQTQMIASSTKNVEGVGVEALTNLEKYCSMSYGVT